MKNYSIQPSKPFLRKHGKLDPEEDEETRAAAAIDLIGVGLPENRSQSTLQI